MNRAFDCWAGLELLGEGVDGPGGLVDREGADDPDEQHGQRVDDQKRLQQLPHGPLPAHLGEPLDAPR